jgi:transcriptional regulator with XRE-family HTH domain
MPDSLKKFKDRALAQPDVKKAYEGMDEEFAFLEEVLKARAAAGLTQAEVAARIGTTQSAIARLESPSNRRFPSVETLQKYARALGCRVEIKFVPDERKPQRPRRQAKGSTRRTA